MGRTAYSRKRGAAPGNRRKKPVDDRDTVALDARTRSSLYGKFAEMLGDDDANALMSQFPSVEADELVTKQFVRQTVWLAGTVVAAAGAIIAAVPLVS